VERTAALVSIASDLTAALSSEERHRRLLGALLRVIPYDAAVLLRREGEDLVPIACAGLADDAMGRRFRPREHPRLELICRSQEPVLFPSDSELPDPFDGLLAEASRRIHACLGCPLRTGDELIGALTADATQPRAFDDIDPSFLRAVAALAAAELRTTQLIEALEQSARRQGLIARDLMRDVQLRQGTELLGTTPVMGRLRQEMDLVARSDYTVLIVGETGTGKELVARGVHATSARRAEPMLYVNCAALPENLVDSELFGHVRGAFTGATADRSGKLEVASGGTLFLDEIGELPLSVQPKLLRAIQQGEIQRVGSDKAISADVRLIAATNRDLERAVSEGKFRADLFHRLNVYPLRVPPLRDRADDIPLLAGHFCDAARRQLGLGRVHLDASAIASLKSYAWPGNVRELENVLLRVTLRAAGSARRGGPIVLRAEDLDPELAVAPALPSLASAATARGVLPAATDFKHATRDFQRALVRRALLEHAGNWAAAARSLGMHRSNFHHLAKRLGLKEAER